MKARHSVAILLGTALFLASLGLWGCADPGPPTVTFEAEGFIRRYMAQRDEFIRRTAPAHARCAKPAAVETEKCKRLASEEAAWSEQDTLVLAAVLAGKTVRSIDVDKATELGLKVLATAADIAL